VIDDRQKSECRFVEKLVEQGVDLPADIVKDRGTKNANR